MSFLLWSVILIIAVVVWINYPRPQKKISGQTVLITGGGSGIGRLMGLYFSKEGCPVVLWDINIDAVNKVVQEIKTAGGTAYAYKCDVSNREEIYQVAAKVQKEVGKVDIVVNNAGVVTGNYLLELKDENIERLFKINVLGVMYVTKAFLGAMMDDNRGHIVTISSAASVYGTPKMTDYVASKWAAFGFAEALRLELRKLKKTGIQTTVVCPYYINTGMFDGVKSPNPLFPILDPQYVAKSIVLAVKTNQKELYLPRQVMSAYLLRFLPVTFRDFVDEYFVKISATMDDFKGQRALK